MGEGRAAGDYGTHQDAVEFVLARLPHSEAGYFIYDWAHGDLAEWPEFTEWLSARPSPTKEKGA